MKQFATFLLITVVSVAVAHEDPLGDLYPLVKVENGNFVIYFYNNNLQEKPNDYDMSGNSPVYRMVYSPTGELLGPRALCKNISSETISNANSMVYTKKIPLNGETVIFELDYLRAKPSYFVEKNGVRKHRRLPWPDQIKINYVASVYVDENQLVMSATTDDHVLRLFHFDRHKFESPAVASVGKTTFIYDFPGASNVVYAADRFWLAWVHYNSEKKKFETILSSWKPGDEKPQERVLDSPSDWNTELSMAAIDNHLCVAYHCSVAGEYPGYSQIITAFHDAKQ
jgi:hypothetical protein